MSAFTKEDGETANVHCDFGQIIFLYGFVTSGKLGPIVCETPSSPKIPCLLLGHSCIAVVGQGQ